MSDLILPSGKTCSGCGLRKPLEAFHRLRVSKDGRRARCRDCHYLDGKRRREADKASYNAYIREYQRSRRLRVLTHYSGGEPACACCGDRHVEFLCMDHTDGGGNAHRKALGIKGGQKFYDWLITSGFPPGFRVLCHNCNASYGLYGYCPHERKEPHHHEVRNE